MPGVALYLLGLACLALGLGIAVLQAENHARGHALQQLERANLDLEVTNRELDARLTARLQALEAEFEREPERPASPERALGVDAEVLQ